MNSFTKPQPQDDVIAVGELYKVLGCKDPLTRDFIAVCFQAIKVFDYKQSNYGPTNIAKFGEDGIVIRISDKFERRVNLWRKKSEPADETVDDTWGDIAVYALLALMCRWNLWPGVLGVDAQREKDSAAAAEQVPF